MIERPQLVIGPWIKGEPFNYRCSLCGQAFTLPEDRSPKEAMAELWTAFHEHVREVHGPGPDSLTLPGCSEGQAHATPEVSGFRQLIRSHEKHHQ